MSNRIELEAALWSILDALRAYREDVLPHRRMGALPPVAEILEAAGYQIWLIGGDEALPA